MCIVYIVNLDISLPLSAATCHAPFVSLTL